MLRPEANPLHEDRLSSEQTKACKKLKGLLERAKPPAQLQEKRPEELLRDPLLIPYPDFRTNRMIFIDGVAGVGKTTVYLTAKHGTEKEYVWLDPLELAILDRPSNALAELLTHIEQRCSKTNDGPRKLNEKQEKVLRELKNLQTKIALLWDGNPSERAARVSPQAFAAEVVDASEGRAELRSKLNKLIDNIADLFFKKKLLVLPVDDLHENPSVALGLLRLMRLIHSPYLVVLAIGNLHSLRIIEQLRARHQLTEFLHQTDGHDEDLLSEVKSRAETLGAFSMNKLFCSAQTIRVDPPDTDKNDWEWVRKFRPDGSPGSIGLVQLVHAALLDAFRKIPDINPDRFHKYEEILSFLDKDHTNENYAPSYLERQRRRIFKMPIRNLVSMYRALELGYEEMPEDPDQETDTTAALEYPVDFCCEMLEQSRMIEYNSGLPDDLFEFDTEDINRIKLSSAYKFSTNFDSESHANRALLVYVEADESLRESRRGIRPSVAAWAHLLLCFSKEQCLHQCLITKKPREVARPQPPWGRRSRRD